MKMEVGGKRRNLALCGADRKIVCQLHNLVNCVAADRNTPALPRSVAEGLLTSSEF